MSQCEAICLVFHAPSARWVVREWDAYKAAQQEYRAPIEALGASEFDLLQFIASQMNRSESAAKFWLYNAKSKMPSGGRLAYARMAMEMATARAMEARDENPE